MDRKYVVSLGNPWDGMSLVGPFDTAEEACDWAEEHSAEGEEYFVKVVLKPAEVE